MITDKDVQKLKKTFVTKDDLKKELSNYATKSDLQQMADDFAKTVTEIVGTWGEKLQDSIERLKINHQEVLDDHEKRITKLEERKTN